MRFPLYEIIWFQSEVINSFVQVKTSRSLFIFHLSWVCVPRCTSNTWTGLTGKSYWRRPGGPGPPALPAVRERGSVRSRWRAVVKSNFRPFFLASLCTVFGPKRKDLNFAGTTCLLLPGKSTSSVNGVSPGRLHPPAAGWVPCCGWGARPLRVSLSRVPFLCSPCVSIELRLCGDF